MRNLQIVVPAEKRHGKQSVADGALRKDCRGYYAACLYGWWDFSMA